jgi:N-acetylglutamate synthase-like GNAT family acetyltransferase
MKPSIPDIGIISYTPLYQQQVVDLILDIQQIEFDIPISLEAQPDLQQIHTFYQQGNGNFWLAITGEKVVGTIALLDIGNQYGALRKMFVKTAYRGWEAGVGQALLNTLFDWAIERSLSKIFLGTTEKFLAAQRFYEKNGFTEIERAMLPTEFPVMKVDVKFYQYIVHK